MNKEIETRFLDINKEELVKKLKLFGATDKGEVKLDEIIFYDRELKWLDEKKLIKIRKNGDLIKLIFKNNKEKTIDGATEIEFIISSLKDAKAFLEGIGFVAYRIVEKYRHSFVLEGVTIDIDTWPKIPVYAEIEGDSVENIKYIVEKLNLKWEIRFDGDPRFVYKHYGFDFDKIRIVTFDKFE